MSRINALVLAGGAIHDFKAVGGAAVRYLQDADGFHVTHVEEDLDLLTKLDPYDLLVFHWTIDEITDAQLCGLMNWVAAGNGYVGIHSAADSFRKCPAYRAFVGGYFLTHPRYRQYQVSIADSEHEITQGLEPEYMVTDEQYITDYDPRNHILATALYEGRAMPVAWTKPWGQGRVYWLALGHDGAACEHELFQKMLVQGAHWAATKTE